MVDIIGGKRDDIAINGEEKVYLRDIAGDALMSEGDHYCNWWLTAVEEGVGYERRRQSGLSVGGE